MRKYAVIAAINDYRGYADKLDGPEYDATQWMQLLKKYNFTKITLLTSTSKIPATRANILAAFKNLISESAKDDQLQFIFLGHGRVVKAHVEGPYEFEEALIAYPEKGDTKLKGAEITDSDITQYVKDARVAQGTDFSIIVDSCFAAYLDVPIPPGAKILSIPNPAFARNIARVREFGSLGGAQEHFISQRPLIVAAAGRMENALEVPANGIQRMLFSWRATEWLRGHSPTFYELIYRDIVPLKTGFPQTPELRGNVSEQDEKFPGEANQQPRSAARTLVASAKITPSGEPTREMREGETMYWLDVRFQGICCFAEAQRESDPYKKRLLLPYDDRTDPRQRHIAFVETAFDAIESVDGPGPTKTNPHVGGGAVFWRWELKGHRIDFENAAAQPSLGITSSFVKHVPGLWTLCRQEIDYHPRKECFDDAPPSTLVAGFSDLAVGILTGGPLENIATTYMRRKSGDTDVLRTPKFVSLALPITAPAGVVTIVPIDGGEPTTITLKEGASVLIGNMRDADIYEDPDAGDEVVESFLLYYYLAAASIDDPSYPAKTAVPVNGCSNSTWP